MEIIKEFENEECRLQIFQDLYPENPRDWDNLGIMVCWHRRYSLGDKHNYKTPEDFLNSLAEELRASRRKALNSKKIIALPLYLYDHSGLTISTDCSMFREFDSAGWDWGQVGWVYVTMEKARKEFGEGLSDKEIRWRAQDVLRQEVKTYDSYLRGEVYAFTIEKKIRCETCGHIENEIEEWVKAYLPELELDTA